MRTLFLPVAALAAALLALTSCGGDHFLKEVALPPVEGGYTVYGLSFETDL